MRSLLLLIILCIFASPAALAQTGGKLEGHVVDDTGLPLPGAHVQVRDTERGTVTDANGYYYLLNLMPGSYSVSASMVGFATTTTTDVIININRTTTVDFELREAVFEADEITVTAQRPDIVRDRTASAEIFRMRDVEDNPGIRDISDVLALSADVMDGHFRGGRQGEELYNLAGMSIVNPLSNARAFAPIMSAIEEVEVITSGFSAQYGNAQSGVVNISMREGRSNRWEGSAEVRNRLPGYKHFGGSVFSEANNPYLAMLSTPEQWAAGDVDGNPHYAWVAYGFLNHYDSLTAPIIAHAVYQQARRDLNREYNNLWDQSVDISLGGPLARNARMFFATRFDQEWAIVPPEHPDVTRQAMGNIAVDVGQGMSVRFSGAYDLGTGHNFRGLGSQNYRSYRDWLWDRAVGVNNQRSEAVQLGVRWSHALSAATFYEVKVNRLVTNFREGSNVFDPLRTRDDVNDGATWRNFNPTEGFRTGHPDNRFMAEQTQTVSLDASLTSQVTPNHMLLAGVQANTYLIDVDNLVSMSSVSATNYEEYRARPWEIGLYVQDKMEFQGMIANIGLRLDAYNPNTEYFVDIFSPLRNPNFDPSKPATGDNRYYHPTLAARERTGTEVHVQPRLGISFPISEVTVFHLNYGSFLQRPSFERTIFSRINRHSDFPARLGNPNLRPERTESYEVGLAQGLGEGFTLDLSGYYKDVKNLIEQAVFYDQQGTAYEIFLNRDYADIRGFRVAVNKRRGMVRGAVRYNYSIATGKTSSPFDSPSEYHEAFGPDPVQLPDPRDILLDFDRTHNVVTQLSINTPRNFGFSIAGVNPLERLAISGRSTVRSGRPFGELNIYRSPAEFNTDLKVTKTLPDFGGVSRVQVYAEVFNLLNNRVFRYNSVFRNEVNQRLYLETVNQNGDVHEALRYYVHEDRPEFLADQRFLIYGNQPRQLFFGVSMDF
jgi:outer membrane receptor protein involved in Fe transport